MYRDVRRGDIYIADLTPVVGSEMSGVRPVVIIQNDVGNHFSPTTIVVPLTTQTQYRVAQPTHVYLEEDPRSGIRKGSMALTEQVRVLDKSRLFKMKGRIGRADMAKIDEALEMSIGLKPESVWRR